MLVPECHEIFVCAQGCLRGVVLSAAELGLQRRFSTITVTEEHLRDGQLEDTIIEGVTHILERLPKLPPAVLVYSSCLHHFSGADLGWAYRKLSEAFPDAVSYTHLDVYKRQHQIGAVGCENRSGREEHAGGGNGLVQKGLADVH